MKGVMLKVSKCVVLSRYAYIITNLDKTKYMHYGTFL